MSLYHIHDPEHYWTALVVRAADAEEARAMARARGFDPVEVELLQPEGPPEVLVVV